ncbi:hypothetical protein LMG27952_06606 [Paraburkholderia hiiakae]|uniref:ChrR-like cupin domain-containing protein n=1 Tax=Paraburkholderia hiiakae TaxID=1081782 RepID=A0ABN7IHH6_9BURK|nr:2,4'-dihydroxyacetophenone dioxygenase family protein [Paraburkholderia hiiakae]CAD6558306.1 hypothetical protein LMG27952_06606 [Paraburkholderia hiiakae]
MALPESVTHQDKLLSINTHEHPFLMSLGGHPGVDVFPLFIDPHNGVWMMRARFKPGITLPMHFHTGVVHLYTLSGCWYYTEYPDQKQTAGCYLFEPGGSIHQFNTPADNMEDTDFLFMINGANVNFLPNGEYAGMLDANSLKGWVDLAINEQQSGVRYISSSIPTYSR